MEKKTERRDWGEIKNAYITGKESLNKLAERYEIPLRTIKDRSRKENWVEERKKFRTEVAQKASQKTAKKEVKRLVKLRDVAEDVADLIGFENYLKLIDVYAAETIYIPKRDSFERIARNQRIVEEYNGDNLKALAKKYNLTTVTIRAIVEDKHREILAKPLDGQLSFFHQNVK